VNTQTATDPSWIDRTIDGLAYLPVLAAAVVLLAGLRAWYRRTLGRRRDRYQRLSRLGTNAHISFFTSVLGEPPAIRRSIESTVQVWPSGSEDSVTEDTMFWESIWIDRDFYVHAFSKQEDDAIVAFSFTTRQKRFRPGLRSPGYTIEERSRALRWLRLRTWKKPLFDVRLGLTRFEELGPPGKSAAWLGAHNMHYYEARWYGNPGHYQWYVFSINDAGFSAFDTPLVGTLMPQGEPWDFAWGFGDDDPAYEEMAGWQEFRRGARINTYTVIGPTLGLEDYPPTGDLSQYPTIFGPRSDHVRTIP
jgi:hypothetical protein